MEFTLRGRTYTTTAESVEEAMASVEPQGPAKYRVEVGGRSFPIKQVLATMTGLASIAFTTQDAYRVLARLGFAVTSDEEKPDKKLDFTALAELKELVSPYRQMVGAYQKQRDQQLQDMYALTVYVADAPQPHNSPFGKRIQGTVPLSKEAADFFKSQNWGRVPTPRTQWETVEEWENSN